MHKVSIINENEYTTIQILCYIYKKKK